MFGSDPPLRVLSLFSGAGGLDVGLDRTGRFQLDACVELHPTFCATLRRNRDAGLFGSLETRVLEADLAQVGPDELLGRLGLAPGDIDVVVGGPPCQAFSTAGRRRSVADPRGELLWRFLDVVLALRPRYFVMENVRGLLSAALRHRPIAERPDKGGPPLSAEERSGSVIALWADDLRRRSDGEYRADCFEVNAVNYGAPQLRERVILIGNRDAATIDFPQPTHGPRLSETGAPADGLEPFATLRDAIGDFHEVAPTVLDFSPRKKSYLAMVPEGGNWRALPEEVARESMGRAFVAKGGRSGWWRRLSWDLPCPTIVTMPNHASTSMCHPTEVRALSVGECARIQGFPDGWTFEGTVQEQMTQVGNAVPVRLAEIAGALVAECIDEPGLHRSAEVPPSFRRVYIKSHVRTRQWFRQGEVFVWDGIGGSAHYRPARRAA